jgi:hypothetical protein
MFKKYWFVFLASAFTITAIITGCETLQKAEVTGGREYFPNTDGYSWTYRATSSSTTEIQTSVFSFTGSATIDSLSVQIWKTGSPSGTFESYLRVTDADVKFYGSPTYPSTVETSIFLVFPLKVGSKWNTYGTTEANVIAQENVMVPLGTYNNCFKVQYGSGSMITYMWFGKNVGMVKLQTIMGTVEVNGDLTSKNF